VAERFVEVRAQDGLSLTGMEMRPGKAAGACLVWVPGFGVGYDLPQCARLGRELARRGIAFVSAGLRGQHGGVTGWRYRDHRVELARVGGWWEIFEESAWDVAAWVEHAVALGHRQVVLAGHSFGALRAVFYLARCVDPRVAALVTVSLSFGLRALDPETARLAARLVAEGRGEQLLPEGSWPHGFGTTTVSAQTYASWWRVAPGFFGPGGEHFAGITCPLLVLYGSADVGGQEEIGLVIRLARAAPRAEGHVLEGVGHGYVGGEATIAEAIAAWIATLALDEEGDRART